MNINSLNNINSSTSINDDHLPDKKTPKYNRLQAFLKSLFSNDLKLKKPGSTLSAKKLSNDIPSNRLEKEIGYLDGENPEIEVIESDFAGREAAIAIVDVKNWASRHIKNTNRAVTEGMVFLERVLPPSLLKNEILKIPFKVTDTVTNSATIFLGALDIGINGLALINKVKILHHSKELLEKLKQENGEKIALLKAKGPTADSSNEVELNKIQKILLEWEVRLNQEEKVLSEEKIGFGTSLIATVLGTACTVLGFISLKSLASFLNKFGTIIAIPASLLGIFLGYRGMEGNKHNYQTLMDWATEFRTRGKHYHDLSTKNSEQIASLLEKRHAKSKEKAKKLETQFKTLEPEIKALKQKQFDQLYKESTIVGGFEAWYKTQSKDKLQLLEFYVDHQETIELTVKNSLRQMVTKKHAMEARLLNFKYLSSTANFTAATVVFGVSLALAIIGLATTPLGGAGFILLGLSVGSTIISVGLVLEGHRRAYIEKPTSTWAIWTQGIEIRMFWGRFRSNFYSYRQTAKKERLTKSAKHLYQLQQTATDKDDQKYLSALKAYKKAKADVENNQKKIAEWDQRLKKFKNIMTQKGWKDFSRQASLKISEDASAFDTLQAFVHAFENCDITLLSKETKKLLETELGIDLANLEEQHKKNPHWVKNTLQNFFTLNDSELVEFMGLQKARMEAGLIG